MRRARLFHFIFKSKVVFASLNERAVVGKSFLKANGGSAGEKL